MADTFKSFFRLSASAHRATRTILEVCVDATLAEQTRLALLAEVRLFGQADLKADGASNQVSDRYNFVSVYDSSEIWVDGDTL